MTGYHLFFAAYISIFLFTWNYMYSLINTVCEDLRDSILREIDTRKLAGEDLNFNHLTRLAEAMVRNFRKHSLRNSLFQNTWMCFMLLTCSFSDSDDFEENFKIEFKTSALREIFKGLAESGQPQLKEFTEILRSLAKDTA